MPSGEDSAQARLEGDSSALRARRGPAPGEVRVIQAPRADWLRLRTLPWGIPLAEWAEHGVAPLAVRKGESRHEVLFVEAHGRRYAIKETGPEAAAREISVYHELRPRGCRTLEPVGYVVISGEPIPVGEMGGRPVYMSGDVGYCITRLAERVLPQSLLYRYPFTDANKRLLWNAIAELLLDLHEAGVYWGDPSLANLLIDLSDKRLTAVMADAETAQVVNGPLSEGMRQQDLDAFIESLTWQAEDIRLARGLDEDAQLVTEGDAHHFLTRYAGLRAERKRQHGSGLDTIFARLIDLERRTQQLNALGYGVLSFGPFAAQGVRRAHPEDAPENAPPELAMSEDELRVATVRSGWYVRRLRELLGVRVPRAYAARLYHQINLHKWLRSERAGYDVGMDTATRDWYTRYHQPILAFLDAYLPSADVNARYEAYLGILNHTWRMTQREQRPVPIEEGAMDYALSEGRAALATDSVNDAASAGE